MDNLDSESRVQLVVVGTRAFVALAIGDGKMKVQISSVVDSMSVHLAVHYLK